MTKANAFQQLGASAIKVLARLEARKAAKEQLRQRGIRDYRHVELLQRASEYLAAHPELYEVALARAWQMGMDKERINATLYDDKRRPVGSSDNAKTGVDNAQQFPPPKGD